ncbi:MAG: hypothetical protein AABX00_00645 [Nanoarchaeota archaeon]
MTGTTSQTLADPASDFSSLDAQVETIVHSQRRKPNGQLAAELNAAFIEHGFLTATHQNGQRTALIGVNSFRHAKVQAVLDPASTIYARYNGKPYGLDEPILWETPTEGTVAWKAYNMKMVF